MLARRAALTASTQGRSGGSSRETKESVRGECNEYGWVLCGGEAPLSWWFSAGVVLLLASTIGSSSLGWAKRSVGWVIS